MDEKEINKRTVELISKIEKAHELTANSTLVFGPNNQSSGETSCSKCNSKIIVCQDKEIEAFSTVPNEIITVFDGSNTVVKVKCQAIPVYITKAREKLRSLIDEMFLNNIEDYLNPIEQRPIAWIEIYSDKKQLWRYPHDFNSDFPEIEMVCESYRPNASFASVLSAIKGIVVGSVNDKDFQHN